MKNAISASAALLLTTTIANAGGIERATPSAALLFEDGDYLELTFGYVSPNVSGEQALSASPGSLAGSESDDIAENYLQIGIGYKTDLSEKFALAFVVGQPYGADVSYDSSTTYVYGGGLTPLGSTASIDTLGFTTLLSYAAPNNITVYGGLRALQISGEVALFNTYTMSISKETDFGYVVGAGWERPDIAARVSLTYESAITHDFTATESIAMGDTVFSTTIPQALTLEGQTGVAADTLLFGSIRWVDWSEFDITPTAYDSAFGGSLVDYSDDVITYNLGLGRRFNDQWSGAVTAGYEASTDGFSGNLGPTNGNTSLGLGVTHTMDNVRITGGIRYIWIGDAETEAPAALGAPAGTTLGDFDDNSGWAAGLKIAYNF